MSQCPQASPVRSEDCYKSTEPIEMLPKDHLGNQTNSQQRFAKTEASGKPVALLDPVRELLIEWRKESLFNQDQDFLFPSVRLNGTKPLSPEVLKKIIRPAMARAGITGKIIGWHSFRHSLARNLRSLGVDVKIAQELLRHANSRVTMGIYTQAVFVQKREASERVFEMMLVPEKKKALKVSTLQHPWILNLFLLSP
jgi:integrase